MESRLAPATPRRAGTPCLALVALVAIACGQFTRTAAAQPLAVDHATDVPRLWKAGQHLYVKGNLGVGPQQLNDLESWLRAKATNWTVVLLEQAADERFTDAEGSLFTGMDAVEHALGKGLPSQTAFGQFTDPRTGERNGAFFVLFLQERKFSYYGSDAYDRRGLGEDRWAGQLDQPAIAAMRGGGRIADAARDTITSIDRQLAQRITAERTQREQQEAAARADRERTLAQAKASLETATTALTQLEQRLATFTGDYPQLAGDLAHPPLPQWRADLETAAASLAGGNPPAARTLAEAVITQAKAALRALEDYRQARPEFDALARRLDDSDRHPQAAATTAQRETARTALANARKAWERGNADYTQQLATARQQVSAAETALTAAARTAMLRRQAAVATTAAGGLGLLALGVVLNRLRRPSRREALALVDAWTQALDEKTLALFKLLERTTVVIGASADEAHQRFAGATLELSSQIIHDVDELTIMSSCASRILAEAKALAQPAPARARALNCFFAGRYKAAVRRLRHEPIAFRPEEGLERVMRGTPTERDRLLGSLESYQPFQFSFTELIAAFNQRAERALAALHQVESAFAGIGDALKTTEEAIAKTKALESQLQSDANGLFQLAPLFSQLLPAAERALAEAAQVSIRDAVGALAGQAAIAQRRAADALALAQLAAEFQHRHQPRLITAADPLSAAGLQTAWLPDATNTLSARADQLALNAVETAVAADIDTLRADILALVDRAERIVGLDQSRRGVSQESIRQAQETVATARAELARPLNKTPDVMLREPGLDPSERLAQAQAQWNAATAALERGADTAAHDSLAEVARLTQEAVALVQTTRQTFAAHDADLAARLEETNRLERELPKHESILVDLAAGYAPATLQLAQGDPTHPNANGTVRDNLEEATEHLAACRQLTDQSVRLFQNAQILQSADVLRQVAARQEQTAFRLLEITEKQQRLRNTETANDTLVGLLNQQVRELEPGVADPRTMRPTLEAFETARQQLADAGRLRQVTPRNPFAVADGLATARETLDHVTDQIRRDRESHAAAAQSTQAAAAEIEVAQRLRRDAAHDTVPDSPGILQAGDELEALSASLADLAARLEEAHGDWSAVDADANRIAQVAGRAAASLRGELEAAEKAVAALNTAAARVRAAGTWTGGLGVLILGSPGSNHLEQARRMLQTGSYQEAWRIAEAARHAADLAIAQAEAELQQRRRAEEERRERERRARLAAEQARRHAISSSGFRSSGIGRSGFSSGSGASRSSFRSGSGVRRSGW